MKKKINIWFSDFWFPSTPTNIENNELYQLLSPYFDFNLTKDYPDYLIYSWFGFDFQKYDCIRLYYTGENIRPNFKECDYAFSFDYLNNERNYRLPIYRLNYAYKDLIIPQQNSMTDFEKRKFCCFLYSNPRCKVRNQFYHLLSSYKTIDSGGKLFQNIPKPVPVGDEIEWMRNYKFCIAFENSSFPGYTTEKLLHALVANTIPIYWGNPLIYKDFNPNAFINVHEFRNISDAIKKVIELDQNPSEYQRFLNEPRLPGNQEIDECKEDNIIRKFDEIFSSKEPHISVEKKRRQKFKPRMRLILKKIRIRRNNLKRRLKMFIKK